jgi:hypothetical protein
LVPVVDNTGAADADLLADLTARQLLEAWESSPALVTITVGPEHVLAFQNATSRSLFGARELGLPLCKAFPEVRAESFEAMDRVRREGVPVHRPRDPIGVPGRGGVELHLLCVFAPLGPAGPGEAGSGVVMTAIDVTDRVDAERLAFRSRLLAEVSGQMAQAADADGALQRLTDALVPAVADVAAVYVHPVGPSQPLMAGTRCRPEPPAPRLPPRAFTVAPELLHQHGHPPTSGPPSERPRWEHALSAQRPVLLEIPPPGAHAVLTSNPTDQWLSNADGHTVAVLPLAVAGELAGGVVLVSAGSRSPYTETDLPFLEDVAARAGAAVTHLRTFDQQRQIARDLQRALLPEVPTTLPGQRVAARYVAGGAGVEVGGDWWDVHDLGGGRTGIGVGDVAGRGLAAAVVMGQARSAMHAAALAGLSPARVLDLLDLHLADLVRRGTAGGGAAAGADHPQFATASYAVIDRRAGTLTVANAGHLPLLVRRPGCATVAVQAVPGPPLGIGAGDYAELEVPFGPGCLLAAFTDGLVESRQVDAGAGVELLRLQVDAAPVDDLEGTADRLLGTLDGRAGQDDMALVLLRQQD